MQLSSALRILLPMLAVGSWLAIATLVGRWVTRDWRYRAPLEAIAVSMTLGMGILGLVLFALGAVGGLRLAALASVLLALVALAAAARRELRAEIGALWAAARHRRGRWHGLLVALPLATVLGAVLYFSWYPPTQFDATMYHLPYVARSLASGRLPFGADLRYPVFPQLAEVMFTGVTLFSNELAAQVLNVGGTALAALLLGLWAREFGKGPPVWAATFGAALWLGCPGPASLGSSAYVEPMLALWMAGTGFLAARFSTTRDEHWLRAAGFCAGAAAATKYTGLVAVAALLAWIAWRRFGWRRLGSAAAMAALSAGPWYLRILILTGNPVAPINWFWVQTWSTRLSSAATAPEAISERAAALANKARYLARAWLWLGGASGLYSPALLLALPCAGWAVWRWRPGLILFAAGLAWVGFYQGAFPDPRHLVPGVVLLVVLVATGLAAAIGRWPIGTRNAAAVGITILLLVPSLATLTRNRRLRAIPPLSVEARDLFLGRRVPGYKAIEFLNRTRGSDYSVYVNPGESLVYYARGRYAGDVFGPKSYAQLEPAFGNADWLYARLRGFDADHLILRAWNLQRRLPTTPDYAGRFRLIYEDADSLVYELLIPAAS
jgi:hypothetical protein